MPLEEYSSKCEKLIKGVEGTFKDRAYKMLAIANPANGPGFFQLLFKYDWGVKGLVTLTKEKLYILGMSRLSADRYCVRCYARFIIQLDS